MKTAHHIRALINRLARLDCSQTWSDDLNPAQISALEYLSAANRFSRTPSHVAEYLGTTRGTMSQTLKALMRKGCVSENQSEMDKRSIRYDLTDKGLAVTGRTAALTEAIDTLPINQQKELSQILASLLTTSLAAQNRRGFGICRDCNFHRKTQDSAFCALLSLTLAPKEGDQICHEYLPVSRR